MGVLWKPQQIVQCLKGSHARQGASVRRRMFEKTTLNHELVLREQWKRDGFSKIEFDGICIKTNAYRNH